VISWNDYARFCPGGIPTSPCGGTDLAGVLKFVKPADGTSIKLILISDGEPDDEDKALKLASQFKSKIDCIFVGPESSPGREFLRRLAMATGGISVSQSVADIANLQQTVTKLLTA
jgi:tryptophan synthase alpha subunit